MSITEPTSISVTGTLTDISCNGVSDGALNITVTGGTPGYLFTWNIGETTEDINGLTEGQHRVTVQDSKFCEEIYEAYVNEPSVLTISDQLITDVSCFGLTDGAVAITVTGGTTPYAYLWDDASTVSDLSGLSNGSYLLTVTDNNTCTDAITVTIDQPLAALTATPVVTSVSCNGDNSGAVDPQPSGGTAPYRYAWNDGSTTTTLTNQFANFGSVTITDDNDCTISKTFDIDEPDALLLSISCTEVSISGASDGSSTILVSGGETAYTYSWSGGTSTTNTVTGLTSGGISVTVTDGNGCISITNCVIDDPGCSITLTTSATEALCFGEMTGGISTTVEGGLTPYTYNWSNSSTTSSITGLLSGTYDLTVSDGAGCYDYAFGVLVDQPSEALSIGMICNAPSVSGASDGSSSVTVTGGTVAGDYTYSWSNGGTTSVITGLGAGSYVVTVSDDNNCQVVTGNSCDLVDPVCNIVLNVTASQVSCQGESNSQGTVTATGGLTPYTYAWTNGETTITATGLSIADAQVSVSDASGCSVTESFTVSEPSLMSVVITVSDASCNGATNGAAEVFATAGNGGYTYLWDTNATTALATGLTVGTYDVSVYDANMCLTVTSATIDQPLSTLAVSVVATSAANCGQNNGSITVTGTGGTPGYGYQWSTGASSATVSSIPGDYSVTITDSNGCDVVDQVSIPGNDGVTSVTVGVSDVLCNGASTGSMTLTPVGGTSPYTFFWIDGSTISGATVTYTGLLAGSYPFNMIDANNCTSTSFGVVDEPTALVLLTDAGTSACEGASDAGVSVTGSGGEQPYEYSWFDGSTVQSLSGLSAGTYGITLTDDNNCVSEEEITITDPSTLLVFLEETDVTCKGGTDGQIQATAVGGTPNYTYEWSNGATTSLITGLDDGAYVVTVTDDKGCSVTNNEVLTEPLVNFLVFSEADSVTCSYDTDGVVRLKSSGGTTPYTYAWNDPSSAVVSEEQTINVFSVTATDLPADVYSFTFTDAVGCVEVTETEVLSPLVLSVETASQNAKCGYANGEVQADAYGGHTESTYTYYWEQEGATTTYNTGLVSDLEAGLYWLTVTDYKGCTVTSQEIVNNPNPFIVIIDVTDVSCYGGSDGSIESDAVGGLDPYEYTWIPSGETTQTITGLTEGIYFVSIFDGNGCERITQVDIIQPEDILVTITETQYISCYGLNDGVLFAEAFGGKSGFTYEWSSEGNNSALQTITGLGPNTYTITATDANLCYGVGSYELLEPEVLSLTGSSGGIDCSGENNGTASVTEIGRAHV